jgi:putative SOS response-associated peptidase YedK
VCNLYSMTTNQAAMRRLARVMRDNLGNQPPLPAIFPDQVAPVIRRNEAGERSLDQLRWGFPPPPDLGNRPVTNVRNLSSAYWRPWLARGFRCLVPANSFCEYTDTQPKVPHWFALSESRPLFAFAGIWRPWTGERKKEKREHLLYAILTTAANDIVRRVHAKAMPVILTSEVWDTWLDGKTEQAKALVRPLANEALRVVATGEREDPPASATPVTSTENSGLLL